MTIRFLGKQIYKVPIAKKEKSTKSPKGLGFHLKDIKVQACIGSKNHFNVYKKTISLNEIYFFLFTWIMQFKVNNFFELR